MPMTDKEIIVYLEDTVYNLKDVLTEKQEKDRKKIEIIKKDFENGGLGLYEFSSSDDEEPMPLDKPLIEEIELDPLEDEKDK